LGKTRLFEKFFSFLEKPDFLRKKTSFLENIHFSFLEKKMNKKNFYFLFNHLLSDIVIGKNELERKFLNIELFEHFDRKILNNLKDSDI
jgi:hypothetical protein